MQNYNTRAQYQGQLKVLLIQACIPEFLKVWTRLTLTLTVWSLLCCIKVLVELRLKWQWSMISPFCSGGHEALSGHQSFVFILICLTEKAQVVVLTKLPDPMCHASTCMTVFSHVLFGYSFIANYLETALLILYSQENNHPLTPNIFCLLCKLRGKKQAESTN